MVAIGVDGPGRTEGAILDQLFGCSQEPSFFFGGWGEGPPGFKVHEFGKEIPDGEGRVTAQSETSSKSVLKIV